MGINNKFNQETFNNKQEINYLSDLLNTTEVVVPFSDAETPSLLKAIDEKEAVVIENDGIELYLVDTDHNLRYLKIDNINDVAFFGDANEDIKAAVNILTNKLSDEHYSILTGIEAQIPKKVHIQYLKKKEEKE